MRGKGWQVGFQHASERITPACAGKSPASGPGCGKTGDHPRVCGEKTRYQNLKTTIQGSPPRVRGKAGPAAAPCPALRITPACAGKRMFFFACSFFFWDHPRVCGEKLLPRAVLGPASGITPACAGKSPTAKQRGIPGRDHPRVCGEKLHLLLCVNRRYGSPPRVRGKD